MSSFRGCGRYDKLETGDEWSAPAAQIPGMSKKPACEWLPRTEAPDDAAVRKRQTKVQKGDSTGGELGQVARSVKELFPNFTFSSALMHAYEQAVGPEGEELQLSKLCKQLVYLNNNLTVFDIDFERSWFSGAIGIEFRSLTGRDAVVKQITAKAAELLAKMATAGQPAAAMLTEG